MRYLYALCVCLQQIILSVNSASIGKAAVWVQSDGTTITEERKPQYITSVTDINSLVHFVENNHGESKIIALLQSKSSEIPILAIDPVTESVRSSSKASIFPTIFGSSASDLDRKSKDFSNQFAASHIMKNAEKVSLLDFKNKIASTPAGASASPLKNGKRDVYVVTLTGIEATDAKLLKELSEMDGGRAITFVGVHTPTDRESLALKPQTQGDYLRVLTSSTASSIILDGIYYKPSGGEYAIYFADTYLYLTPDIFTGAMTGLFFFFVLLTGYSCLSAIQGPSTFPSKLPPLGREA